MDGKDDQEKLKKTKLNKKHNRLARRWAEDTPLNDWLNEIPRLALTSLTSPFTNALTESMGKRRSTLGVQMASIVVKFRLIKKSVVMETIKKDEGQAFRQSDKIFIRINRRW